MRERTWRFWNLTTATIVFCVFGIHSSVSAVDGKIEINQARALAGGVSVGDLPDFPVTLGKPGSYALVGDLDLTDPNACAAEGNNCINVNAIEITASGVTLDLNGFSILGASVCTGSPVSSCTPSGAGRGIQAPGSVHRIHVRNGMIKGMGNSGIELLGDHVHVKNITTVSNGADGIHTDGRGNLVKNNHASRNGNDGFRAGEYGLVVGNVANENSAIGFNTGSGVTIRSNTANLNGGAGIWVGQAALISHNSATFNGAQGIISNANNTSGYAHNVVHGNTGTILNGTNLGGNLCDGSICP